MKRTDLIRHILVSGCVVEREGSRHTIFINLISGQTSSVPRHKEVNTFLGKKICRDLGITIISVK
jgi:hypothetical protein